MTASILLAVAWLSAGVDYSITNATPEFIRRFTLDEVPARAEMTLASAGFHELYVNGEKVGDEVLSPVTCQPDVRVSSIRRDITDFLRVGGNEIVVLTGNGTWSPNTVGWGFETAAWHTVDWRKGPMIFGSLTTNGVTALVTDGKWTCRDSRVTFSQWRYGESYDAARPLGDERPATALLYSPPMAITPEDAPPCRVSERFEPVSSVVRADGKTLYTFPHNLSGWCEIEIAGERGAKVTIDYDESLKDGDELKGHINCFNLSTVYKNHRDEYILAGEGLEKWSPRFAYHGFKYVLVTIEGKAELKAIRQCFVHSDLARAGEIETDSAPFMRFQDATARSYLSNFVGIPTDCPHREQNGWTGDAQLATETGLWTFDSAEGYRHFLKMMLDSQAPNGAVPCVLPHSDWFGYSWGSGPAWDALLFEIPRCLYRMCGDEESVRAAYPAMKRYLGFIETKIRDDGLIAYGLGDWCPVDDAHIPDIAFTDTAYLYFFYREVEKWAKLFGEDATEYATKAERTKAVFNRAFYHGEGRYGNERMTCEAAPLYFKGLCADGEEAKVAERLVALVRENAHRVDYGILGGKWVLRALSDYGFAEDAWKILTQSEYPGYQFWFASGEDTLWERWDDTSSHNHIMFGDPLAWAFEYIAGIVPVEPGFASVAFRPNYIEGVDHFRARVKTVRGLVEAGWERGSDGGIHFTYSVPEGVNVVAAP